MTLTKLFESFTLGDLPLSNRMVMAPMTRGRAGDGRVPTALNAKYYGQRSGAGLIIAEAAQVSEHGIGYIGTPGIHTEAQAEGWRRITDAVHNGGSKIFAQLWHVGRVSHVSLQPDGQPPVAPSAIAAQVTVPTPIGTLKVSQPRALETAEVSEVVKDFAHAAEIAQQAGFDGVEIHGGGGYLVEQFLSSGSNQRTDQYGGSIENRARFLLEIVEAVGEVWPMSRIGVRMSPKNKYPDMQEENPLAVAATIAKLLARLGIGYLHLSELLEDHPMLPAGMLADERLSPRVKEVFGGTVISNGGFTGETAEQALVNGEADLISFGLPFLANPDLPKRLMTGAPLNMPDRSTFYGGNEKGYTDYSFL